MARAARLLEMLIRLRGAPRLTARELADEFGVSRRTMQRDLQALAALGVRLVAAPGPGGGVHPRPRPAPGPALPDGRRGARRAPVLRCLRALRPAPLRARERGALRGHEAARGPTSGRRARAGASA